MLDIGLEIKILRERLKVSSKELAEKIGLSQSQMSRLEKGQRRIDIAVLHRIAEALGVEPAFFLRSGEAPAVAAAGADVVSPSAGAPGTPAIAPALRYEHLGKLIRSERRRRHLTVDELATKVGKTRAYMNSLEEGRHFPDAELADRICRALRLSPNFFLGAQQEAIRALQTQVARLDQVLAEVSRGRDTDEGGGRTKRIPLYGPLGLDLDLVFDGSGHPAGEPEEFLHVPGLEANHCFGLTLVGDAMESRGTPSFRDGDLLVFSTAGIPRSGDFVLARVAEKPLLFRQVFFDPDGTVRLQPLNLTQSADVLSRKNLLGLWKLVLHVTRV